ncbi:glycosyltransferase [Thalassotalea psychrophila]|uniref:Glycosyltransferase n=1 Tax=Thalassotalea psychrophila TaxID=3065647 RepID=A0ABY9TUM4_9GAMM|nr:glycosyltransferase [Colwelliaceae bacterium SQ149]
MRAQVKILEFICPTGFYGAERWILALMNNLDANKASVELVTTAEKENQDQELLNKVQQMGLPATAIKMKHRFDLSVIPKLCKLIQQRNIDIIHSHGYKSDIISLIAAKKCGIKCISTPHGFENTSDFKLRFYIWLGNLVMRYFDRVVPLSPQLLQDCHALMTDKNKLVYIQNGVDFSEADVVKNEMTQGDKSSEKVIGFIGQLISRKNLTDTISAFAILLSRQKNLKLIIIGEGEEQQTLQSFAKQLGCEDKIEFLGYRDDRLKLLSNFDLFMLSSTLEGIPRCLMEAAYLQVPIVAYDIPGVDKIITHNQSGFLAPVGDSEMMAKYAETLLYNDKVKDKIILAAEKNVIENYSAKRMANEYCQLFLDLTKHQ